MRYHPLSQSQKEKFSEMLSSKQHKNFDEIADKRQLMIEELNADLTNFCTQNKIDHYALSNELDYEYYLYRGTQLLENIEGFKDSIKNHKQQVKEDTMTL